MLQPTQPDLPAGHQVIEIGRCAPVHERKT